MWLYAFKGSDTPAREDEPRRDERAEQQALAPQGPVLPPPPPVDYGVFMQGLVQAMQTQAHTHAALQAQLEAQAQVPAQDHGGPSTMERFKRMLPPSIKGESDPLLAESWMREIEKIFRAIRCADEDKITLATYMLHAGGSDGAIPGKKESFAEEASSDIPMARQEESGVPDTAAICGSRQFLGTLCTFPWCEERVSSLWEDTWWYRMLDDYGQVLEVRKQGVQRGAPAPAVATATPATGRPGRPRAPARVFALAREDAEQAEHVTKGVVGDETLVEETLETDSERGD
ncbi:hypothetical protein Taro_000064 [Colocasia esculenta]|uniref:Uncharacterized protein n=1 Tax=Colocasia esculenta TaxID=4460 RepID=A0A843TDR2_COLES|nr:hypothetical protein [Colocasia esculenta]